MGVINCKNCQCNKKEEEASDELNIEGQKKELIKETPMYFKSGRKNEEEPTDREKDKDTNVKDVKGKDLISCQSQSKISIEIHEDKINNIKSNYLNNNNEHISENENEQHEKENENNLIEEDKNLRNEKGIDNYFSNNSNNINNINTNALSPDNNNINAINDISPEKNDKENNLLSESQVHNFEIKKDDTAIKTLEIAKIEFGIDDKNILSAEDQRLYEEAQKNLNQFYPPEQNEVKQIQKKLKKISLKTLLPKSKINEINMNDNTLVFHGELKKMVNYEINAHRPQMYSSRFCILTPKLFKYFKSKEQFLKNLKPQCSIPINQITRINFAKVKKNSKKADHIIICNKLGIIKDKNKVLMDKFISDLNDTSFIASPETNESLLIFTSEIEEVILKWFTLIQFFVERNNNSTK